jgi:hypothetical protein
VSRSGVCGKQSSVGGIHSQTSTSTGTVMWCHL